MKKPQWIVIAIAVVLVAAIYKFGNTIPPKRSVAPPVEQHSENDGHDHGQLVEISTDSLLDAARKKLNPDLASRLSRLESNILNTGDNSQQLRTYHKLSHFWRDTAGVFEPYAWYEAEAARLENSEKTLTFAARLFLGNLQQESDERLKKWKALQAKDLFERSLKLNPDNDSIRVDIGACYLYGNITGMPMDGINRITEVVKKDSTNIYAQMTLIEGALATGQYAKAISRLETVNRLQPGNLGMILLLADMYERTGDPKNAVKWYEKSLPLIHDEKIEIVKQRIAELKK